MTRQPWAALGISILCLVMMGVAVPARASAAEADALHAKLLSALGSAQFMTYDLTLKNRIKGKMQPEESLSVKAAKDGRMYAKWNGKVHKGREMIVKPGWNDGKLWVKEGGAIDFAAVSVGFEDPVVRQGYVRGLDVLQPDKLASLVSEWKTKGQAGPGPDAQSYVLDRGADGKVTLTLDAAGFPAHIVVADAKGVVEDYRFSSVNAKASLSDVDFDVKNPAYGFPGYSADGIYINAERLKSTLMAKYGPSQSYTCLLEKRERVDGKLQDVQTMDVKFRKPGDIYMKWVKDPHKGRQMLWRSKTDEKITVKESGVLGLATVHLAPNSSLVMKDTNHPLTEIDMGFTINMIYTNLAKGQKNGDIKLKFKGIEWVGGRPAYVVESWFNNVQSGGYYAPHSVNFHDVDTGLPVKTQTFEANGDMREEFTWTKIKLNAGLTDQDFDPSNPAYGF